MYVDRDKAIWWFIEHFTAEDSYTVKGPEIFRYIDAHMDIPTYQTASKYKNSFEESIANGWIYG